MAVLPWRAIGIVVVATAAAACYGTSGSASPNGSMAVDPTPTPTAVPSVAPATADELRAIKFRTSAGLRADLAYVRLVAADPTSSAREYSVPLLPEEIAELQARSANADEVGDVVRAYAARFADDYCGLWIDHQNGGALTSSWKSNLAVHEAAIRARVDPTARVAFVPCTFSLKDLRALQDRFVGDDQWFRAAGIALQSVGVDQVANVVEVGVSSAVPDVAGIIADRYDVPVAMLRVISDGTGAAFVPWGEVDVTIVGPDGTRVGQDTINEWLAPGWGSDVEGLRCGHGDMGVGFTNLPCQEGSWTITVNAWVADGEWTTVGSGRVEVVAGETSKLTIRIGPIPTFNPG
jgi:hypothetical protein